MSETETLPCSTHGEAHITYVCQHLIHGSNTDWHSREPDEESPWPDAWCGLCHMHFQAEGEWNERSEHAAGLAAELLCPQCYEARRAACSVHYL